MAWSGGFAIMVQDFPYYPSPVAAGGTRRHVERTMVTAMPMAVLGASFHTAEVDQRERLALDADQTLRLLAAIRAEAIFRRRSS